MEELEQIPLNQTGMESKKQKKGHNRYNPGLRALLSVKQFTVALENDYTELLQIEDELHELVRNAASLIETHTTPEAADGWKMVIPKITKALTDINAALVLAKQKSAVNKKDSNTDLWKQLAVYVMELKLNFKAAGSTGLTVLPETAQMQWENEFVRPEAPLVESLVTYVESCRILLQMIERYTPDELNAITKIIADHVPLYYTYEEALEYQNDYYKALINFKKEFKQEKNLWDKFLDILAGGTHQSPSERVMMERWLDGEKGDL